MGAWFGEQGRLFSRWRSGSVGDRWELRCCCNRGNDGADRFWGVKRSGSSE